MLVFCNGMARSASTWSYLVTKAVLERCYPGEPVESAYTDAPVELLRAARPETRHVVLKSHWMTPLARTLARTRAAKVVFTIRDLGDAVYSAMSTFRVSFEEAFDTVKSGLDLYAYLSGTGNAVILHYEEIVAHPRDSVRRVGEYLAGDRLTPEIVSAIAEEMSFENMRRKVAEITARPRDAGGHDRETHLHRNHMSDGRSGKGRERLTAEQLGRIAEAEREYFVSPCAR